MVGSTTETIPGSRKETEKRTLTYDNMRVTTLVAVENWLKGHKPQDYDSLEEIIDAQTSLRNANSEAYPLDKAFPIQSLSDDILTFLIINTAGTPNSQELLLEAQRRNLQSQMDAATQVPKDLVAKIAFAPVAKKEAPVGSH